MTCRSPLPPDSLLGWLPTVGGGEGGGVSLMPGGLPRLGPFEHNSRGHNSQHCRLWYYKIQVTSVCVYVCACTYVQMCACIDVMHRVCVWLEL